MNKSRRQQINIINNEIALIKDKLQSVLIDEQISFDNMPENLQSSLRGEASEYAIENLEEVIDMLEGVTEILKNI